MTDTAQTMVPAGTNPQSSAKRTRKTNPTPPAFDFTAVKPKDVAPPQRRYGGGTKGANPVAPWLVESWNNRVTQGNSQVGKGKEVTIPAANLTQFKNLLNYAARDLGIGVTIAVGKTVGKNVTVTFAAKNRKQAKKAAKPAAPAAS